MPDMSLLIAMVALILVIGACAGVLAGLLGVGGGIVLVPAFYYAFSAMGYDRACCKRSLASLGSWSAATWHLAGLHGGLAQRCQ